MTQLLISVRSVDEALQAAAGDAHFIDLKEPGQGALGGLPLSTIRDIVGALRAQRVTLPVSATIGDWPMHAMSAIQQQVAAVAACGVDYVKVGITREPEAAAVLQWLAHCGCAVVPVLIADQGIATQVMAQAVALPFAGVMVDTANKTAGSLFDVMTYDEVQQFIHAARHAKRLVGVAGALRLPHLPLLAQLAPDFAGFRSAVCAGDRAGTLDPQRLRALALAMQEAKIQADESATRTSPINIERIQANSVF
jgi:(5-formylfuran-3-yl)methyl phosphate synthase